MEEEELHVVNTISDKQHEERLVSPPTRVSRRSKKNSKYKKKQTKGKHHQKKNIKNKSSSSTTSIIIPTRCHGKLTNVAVTLINTIKTLLLMRGGKRLYMLLAFIAVP